MIKNPEPHLETADSDLLRETILHHEHLIAQHMEIAAGRHLDGRQADPVAAPPELSPEEFDDLENRFVFVLEVACELASRTRD